MPDSTDSIPLWFVLLYCLLWFGVARFAVVVWRLNRHERRTRTSKEEMLTRLWRWKDC
jgi:hypothetical protein